MAMKEASVFPCADTELICLSAEPRPYQGKHTPTKYRQTMILKYSTAYGSDKDKRSFRTVFVLVSCIYLAFSALLPLPGCRHTTEPGDGQDSIKVYTKPVANAGPDLTSRIGSYIILDGGASTRGGGETLLYQWTQSPSNPYQVFVMDDSAQPMGFFQEGAYTFYLVVDNRHYKSDPDTVRIAVASRVPCVIQDTSLEMSIRYALRLQTEELNDENLSKLDTLRLYYIYRTTTLNGIEHCRSLIWLLLGLQHITDVSPLSALTNLQFLSFNECRTLVDISSLATLTNLTKFSIFHNEVRDIGCVANMTNLTYLNIASNPISDFSPLRGLSQLTELVIGEATASDISAVSGLTKLQFLTVIMSNVSDVSAIAQLRDLIYLNLSFNQIPNIDSMKNCTRMRRLDLSDNQIQDISALQALQDLEVVELYNNKVVNIKPLVDNSGVAAGDIVALRGNPLDSVSVNVYVAALRSRGVTVFW